MPAQTQQLEQAPAASTGAVVRTSPRQRSRWRFSPGLLVLLVVVVALVAYPVFLLACMSLNAGNPGDMPPLVWGVDAYRQIGEHLSWLRNSLLVAVPATVLATCLGAVVAWILHRTVVPGRRVFEVLVYLPFALGPFISAFAWVILAAPTGGLINRAWTRVTGLDAPLINAYSAPWIAVIMAIVESPLAVLIIGALMQRMAASLEESSIMTGASKVRTIRKVTLPLLLPAIVSSAVILFSVTLGEYAVPAILGPPARYYTAATIMYQLFGTYPPNYPLASSFGVLLLALCVATIAITTWLMRNRSYPLITGKSARLRPMNIGRWRILTFAILCCYVIVAFILPFGILLIASLQPRNRITLSTGAHWTLENFHYVLFEFPTTRQAVVNTLIVGVAASTVCALLGVLIALATHRSRSIGRGLLRQSALAPQSIPHLVLSLGIFWMVLQLPLHIYGTLFAVLLGFVIVFLPLAYQSAYAAVGSIHAELEEAARVTGAGRIRVFVTVTVPLLLPALVAGWSLVFMASVRNVSAAIFLTETNTQVLGPSIINFYQSGGIGNTSALVVVQALIIAVAVVVVQVASRRRAEM